MGVMQEIKTVEELQKIELEILKYIDKVCKENSLTYFLAYGTLIGAIRHKGFIPWDDDVDIQMPRDDYNKLCEILKKENGRYKLLDHKDGLGYMYPFAKVIDSNTRLIETGLMETVNMGVYIDIFPIDGTPNDPKKRAKYLKKCSFIEKMRYFSISPRKEIEHRNPLINIFRIILWKSLRKIGYQRIIDYLDKCVQLYPVEYSDVIGTICVMFNEKEIMPKDKYLNKINVKFEDAVFCAPEQYDYILTKMYGEYMVKPPVEQQKSHHYFEAWWLD